MSNKLLERLAANSNVKISAILDDSTFFRDKTITQTKFPILNMASSGHPNIGFKSGLTVIAGASKSFKTLLGLTFAKAYLDQHEDAIMLFYDSEFGVTDKYIKQIGIDPGRVLHTPVTHIEELKFDLTHQLEAIERGEKVFIFVDSVGNLPSKKELDDAKDAKSVADMTRAKQMKSLFRIATPYFTIKDIPGFVINHTYKSQGMYPTDVVSGGTGIYYSADNIFIITRSQEKEGTELSGYTFTINSEKSRYVREKSKFRFEVSFDKGINRWSGLLDYALLTGHVTKPKVGWYTRPSVEEDKNWRKKETNCKEFWEPILNDDTFGELVAGMLQLGNQEDLEEEDNNVQDED